MSCLCECACLTCMQVDAYQGTKWVCPIAGLIGWCSRAEVVLRHLACPAPPLADWARAILEGRRTLQCKSPAVSWPRVSGWEALEAMGWQATDLPVKVSSIHRQRTGPGSTTTSRGLATLSWAGAGLAVTGPTQMERS